MYGIFMECVVIFKEYTGLRFMMVLYLVSLIYLMIREENKTIKTIFGYMPIAVLILFFIPLFRKGFVGIGLDRETYYRVLWLMPMGITTAYALCHLFSKHKRIGLAVSTVLVILCGTLVYRSQYISKAENLYHIPDTVIKICDFIMEGEEDQVMGAFPSELVHFIRQYNADIRMPYGRESLVPTWDYYNAVYEAMEKPEVIDMTELVKATREEYCHFIILHISRAVSHSPEEEGMILLGMIDEYLIYKDPVVYEALGGF